MIAHFTDHAANERTFLAWIRTALAVMAFGFLVERFDLFMQMAAAALGGHAISPRRQALGDGIGLLLLLLGGSMMVVATLRYRRNRARIDAPEMCAGHGGESDLVMAGLLLLLGTALFAYLLYHVLVSL
jgi:putative membrane protein